MKLSIETQDDEFVNVRAEGRISQRDVLSAQEPLEELLGESAFQQHVLLDMSEVESIDSSGINWLLICQKRMREGGGRVILHSLSPMAKNVIRVLNLQTVFSLAGDVHEARNILDGERA
jgi:anti-anti-sigma factor